MWFLTSFNSSHFLNNLAQCDVPKLFLIGSRDNFTGVGSFKRLVQGYVKDPKKVEVIDGADHFWFGEEGKVCAVVDGWMRELGVL